MFCARCGKEMDNNSTFCPFCGQKVGEPVKSMPHFKVKVPASLNTIKKKYIIAVAALMLVVVFIFSRGSGDTSEKVLKAYLKYADSMDCEASYYLADIDHDSVPECFVWDYAGNGNLNHARVLGYKKRKLVEVSCTLGGGTTSSSNNIQDGTIFWGFDDDYFILYANRQTWWGDLLKEDACFENIYKIGSSGFEEYHTIIRRKNNNDAYWSYVVDNVGASSDVAESIYSEIYDSYYQSKTPTRYVSIEEAVEEYEGDM